MSSIHNFLQQVPNKSSQFVEQIPSIPQENVHPIAKVENLTQEINNIDNNLSYQNYPCEIQHQNDFSVENLCEEAIIDTSESCKRIRQKKRYFSQKKEHSEDHNLQFFRKILFFTLFLCIIVGAFAAVIQQKLKKQTSIPDLKNGIPKSTIVGTYQKSDNKKSKNLDTQTRIQKNKQISSKINEKATIQNNLKNKNKKTSQFKSIGQTQSEKTSIHSQTKNQVIEDTTVHLIDNLQAKNFQKNSQNQIFSQIAKKTEIQNKKLNQNPELTGKQNQHINQKIKQNENLKSNSVDDKDPKETQSLAIQNLQSSFDPKTSLQNQLKSQALSSQVQPAASVPVINSTKPTIPQPACSLHLLSQRQKYGSLYQFSVNRDLFQIYSNVQFFQQRVPTKLTKQKYKQAVDLLEIVHHVTKDGNVTAVDTPCEPADSLTKRLSQMISKQTQRFNLEYSTDSYFKTQLRFCIVTNSYNNAQNGLIYRNIDSILQQNYTNYHVVYTDDNSPDDTGAKVKQYLQNKNVSEDKIKVKLNKKKVGMMENIYNAITQNCSEGQIAVMLDGDDSFIGTNVLSLLNALYQKKKLALMWNNFLQINDNSRAMMGFSRELVDFGDNFKSYRVTHRFVSSHLKSFYVDLFRKIKKQDLQNNDGSFFGGASDTAIMMPMLQLAHPRYEYVPEILYEYRFDTGQVGMNVNRVPQALALVKIGATEPYQPLQDFSFIDKAIQKAQSWSQIENQQKKSSNN